MESFASHSISVRFSLNFFSEKSGFDRQSVDGEGLSKMYFPILRVQIFGEWRKIFGENKRKFGVLENQKHARYAESVFVFNQTNR